MVAFRQTPSPSVNDAGRGVTEPLPDLPGKAATEVLPLGTGDGRERLGLADGIEFQQPQSAQCAARLEVVRTNATRRSLAAGGRPLPPPRPPQRQSMKGAPIGLLPASAKNRSPGFTSCGLSNGKPR